MDGFSVLFGIFLVVAFLAFWKASFFPSKSLHLHRTETLLCCGVMVACACGVLVVLHGWSAFDVRGDPGELAFYLVSSLAAILASQALFAFLGVSLRDDVIERRNRGALFAFRRFLLHCGFKRRERAGSRGGLAVRGCFARNRAVALVTARLPG
jgi:hypothetical protein